VRLVAFDLDGTLIGPDLELHDDVVKAVAALRKRGVRVVIVTGRMHRSAEVYARRLGLDGLPLVSCNGAMVRVVGRDETWWHRPIAAVRAVRVLDFLAERGLEPLVFAGDALYAGAPDPDRDRLYAHISGVQPEHVGDLRAYLLGPPRLGPTKMIQVEDPGRMAGLYAGARARFAGELAVTTSYPFFLEFMRKDVGKGQALARVCRRLGVRRREVAAFGDGLNDLGMVRWAGLGVAMGGGPPELLEAADRVVDGAPGLGVVRFLEENLLGRDG
jgi:hypothetical protein